jgi:hypothetical protein
LEGKIMSQAIGMLGTFWKTIRVQPSPFWIVLAIMRTLSKATSFSLWSGNGWIECESP